MIGDVVASIIWPAVTFAVLWAAWIAARRIFSCDTVAQCAMHVIILFWTWLAIGGCVVGSLGVLNATTLGVSVLSLGIITVFAFRSRSTKCHENRSSEEASLLSADQNHRLLWMTFWCGIASISATILATHGIAKFPKNWDTLAYHRPLIDLWIQTGTLQVTECPVWFAPGNNELFGLWWAIAFSGDFWVGLMNTPAVLILALGIHEVGRLLELTPSWRHGAAIAVTGTSVVLHQLTSAKNDIAVAGLFIAAVAYLLRYLRYGDAGALSFAGLAAGLLCGIKYYALCYAFVLWIAGTAIAGAARGWRSSVAASFVVATLIFPASAYWYARNYSVSGSPLFPMGYRGHLYPDLEVRRDAWRSSLLGNGEVDRWFDYVETVGIHSGICLMLPLLALPLTLTWMALVANRTSSSGRSDRGPRIALAVSLLGAWLVFSITPLTIREETRMLESSEQIIRFSQAPLALSVLAFCTLLSDITRWLSHREVKALRTVAAILPLSFIGAATLSFGKNALAIMRELNFELSIICVNWVGLLCLLKLLFPQRISSDRQRSPVSAVLVTVALTAAFTLSTFTLASSWHADFARYYDDYFNTQMFSALEKTDRPSAIAAFDTRYYPFFGSRRHHRVIRPQRFTSQENVIHWLIESEINIIAVVQKPGSNVEMNSYAKHSRWMDKEPDIFEPISVADSRFKVYRLNRELLRSRQDVGQ